LNRGGLGWRLAKHLGHLSNADIAEVEVRLVVRRVQADGARGRTRRSLRPHVLVVHHRIAVDPYLNVAALGSNCFREKLIVATGRRVFAIAEPDAHAEPRGLMTTTVG